MHRSGVVTLQFGLRNFDQSAGVSFAEVQWRMEKHGDVLATT